MSVVLKIAVPVVAAGLLIGAPVQASGARVTALAATPHISMSAVSVRTGMISPLAGVGPLTPSQAAAAAATCVRYATRVGWANNGYFGGYLVTAAAICVAESAGHPGLYVCDNAAGMITGQGEFGPGHPVNCPGGTVSYDRGLWQLNTAVQGAATDECAFDPVCNAGSAYFPGSQRGTDFEPWSSYDQDVYTPFIDAVQTAVSGLTAGTVTSALLGECLAQAKSAANAKVVIANCGSGGTTQQWSIVGDKLKSGSVCAAIGAGPSPGIVLRKCAKLKSQDWAVFGHDELRNAADGKCLTDPGSSLSAGTAVDATSCTNAKDQVWWLP